MAFSSSMRRSISQSSSSSSSLLLLPSLSVPAWVSADLEASSSTAAAPPSERRVVEDDLDDDDDDCEIERLIDELNATENELLAVEKTLRPSALSKKRRTVTEEYSSTPRYRETKIDGEKLGKNGKKVKKQGGEG